jgi:hypothetical protein
MVRDYYSWAGPLVLLCHPLLARKLGRALDVKNLRIDWDDLASRCFSSTEVLLCDAARCLSRGEPCDLGRLVRGLDPDPWQWLMAALAVARGERRLEDVLG